MKLKTISIILMVVGILGVVGGLNSITIEGRIAAGIGAVCCLGALGISIYSWRKEKIKKEIS